MSEHSRTSKQPWAQIASMVVGFFIVFSVLCALPVLKAVADSPSGDISVNAQVVESTATSTPKQVVTLTENKSITDALLTVRLVELEPFSLVQVYAQSTPILICSGFADKYGVFECKTKLPSNLEAGEHTIVAAVQNAGSATPTLVVLKPFTVSLDGVVSGKNNSGGSSGGGGSHVTQSPIPSPTESADSQTEGVLYVGGVRIDSESTFNWQGSSLSSAITIHNAYKRKYSVNIRIETTAWGLFGLAKPEIFHVSDLKPNETRMVAQTIDRPGQWGIYTSTFTVIPPRTIDGLRLRPIVRQATTFVFPLIPGTILGILLILELARRFVVAPRLAARNWVKQLAQESNQDQVSVQESAEIAVEEQLDEKPASDSQKGAKPRQKKTPKPTDEAEK
jgi:hypothetical protein